MIQGPSSFATSFCPVLSSHDDSTTTRPTNQITSSSSGGKEKNHWSSRLHKGAGHQNVQQRSKTQSKTPITYIIRWSQTVIRGMVRRDTHFPVSHRLSGVCSNSSSSHWSQRRHHKEGLHWRTPLRDRWRDQDTRISELEEVIIRSSDRRWSRYRSRKTQGGDQEL